MTRTTFRRFGAMLVSAALLASPAGATISAPAMAKASCMNRPATIVGSAKGEVIRGTAGRDVIVAGGGNDVVYGLGGTDIICGGPGDDRVYGGFGHDRVDGGPGNDVLYGGPGKDRVYGRGGGDRVVGGDDNDWLHGDHGPDRIEGGGGNDHVLGGPGPDRLFGGPGVDRLAGAPGDDRLFGGAGQDVLWGGSGTDRCVQGSATGPHNTCEIVAPVSPADLALAWSDLDGDHRYGPDDALISRLFDTNGDGIPSAGDTIYMGRYPVDLRMTAFADWGVDSHEVISVDYWNPLPPPGFVRQEMPYNLMYVGVRTPSGWHWWLEDAGGHYGEGGPLLSDPSAELYEGYHFGNGWGFGQDGIWIQTGAPSQPEAEVARNGKRSPADKGFIDVVVYP